MTALGRPRRWPSPPIAFQILALLLAGLVVAQTVTLVLTVLLPPAPATQHSLADIAAGLRGAVPDDSDDDDRPLVRTVETQPPSLQSPGWVASEQASADLARLLNVDRRDVRLLFYAPPPFAGTESRRGHRPTPLAMLLTSTAYAQTPVAGPTGVIIQHDAGGGVPGAPDGWGGPGPGLIIGGMSARSGVQGFPSGGFAGPSSALRAFGDGSRQRAFVRSGFGGPVAAPGSAGGGVVIGGRTFDRAPATTSRFVVAKPAARFSDPLFNAPFRSPTPVIAPARPAPLVLDPVADAAAREPALSPLGPGPIVRLTPADEPLRTAPRALPPPPAAQTARTAPAEPDAAVTGRALAPPVARSLFGLAPAPFIEGDFVAALRVGPDRWVTLRPEPEAFPNSWQRRVLMWFALSLAVVAPLGWVFARRLAAPLAGFAAAAERLGRDPSSPVMVSDGPAEVGRAARAFNAMQARLTRYITDRTAMIGAISHDLRTPLARMRFRLERASPALRREIGQDIDQMEAMISSVLAFMRDDAEAGARQRVDLRSLLECVIDEAEVTGAEIELEPGEPAEVEVSVLGLQRVFANLVDNAVKYGDSARVRLYVEGDEAVTEIRDQGPGLSPDDLERVFTPFYRSVGARTSSKQGVGLGLSTARSIVRAHGGDIRLDLPGDGLRVQVRLPVARPGPARARPPAEMQVAE
jgi:signal transduction histidine kinase